jgi:hypothetical protein
MTECSPFLRGIELARPRFSRTFVEDPELVGPSVSRSRAPRRRLDDLRRTASSPMPFQLGVIEKALSSSCVLSSVDLFDEE